MPRINHTIKSFVSSWNNHPVRTMKNWSPRKIWTNGMIDTRNQHIRHIQELQDYANANDVGIDDLEWFGMDWSAPVPRDDGLSTVDVDDIAIDLDEGQLDQLKTIDVLENSSSFGIDIYSSALEIFQ